MRLVSQDGREDIPYEKVLIEIQSFHSNDEFRINAITDGLAISMAKYSSMEKAEKVLEDMRNKYLEKTWNYPKVFRFPQDDEEFYDKED